jgi:DNA-binding CsgD family transcriptional regulator
VGLGLGGTGIITDQWRSIDGVYGEWLRRERRRNDARIEAIRETACKCTNAPSPQILTAQEARIARMARDGHSNPEIGARLFISTRTVEYHLQKSSPSSTSGHANNSTACYPTDTLTVGSHIRLTVESHCGLADANAPPPRR